MFIAQSTENLPARFGGAELKLTSTEVVSFRPSEPRGGFLCTDYKHRTLRSEEKYTRLIVFSDPFR